MRTFNRGMTDKIVGALCTRFGATTHAIRCALPTEFQEWSRLRVMPDGDIIRAASFGQEDGVTAVSEDSRNTTFVRVSTTAHRSYSVANVQLSTRAIVRATSRC